MDIIDVITAIMNPELWKRIEPLLIYIQDGLEQAGIDTEMWHLHPPEATIITKASPKWLITIKPEEVVVHDSRRLVSFSSSDPETLTKLIATLKSGV